MNTASFFTAVLFGGSLHQFLLEVKRKMDVKNGIWFPGQTETTVQEGSDYTGSYLYSRKGPREEENFATVSCSFWTCKPLGFVILCLK